MAQTKRSLDPNAPDAVVIVTKRQAATSQLETAITLWFGYGDPVSIHALATAANEVFHGMGRLKGLSTIIQEWKRTLTRAELARANKVQNFCKHAYTDSDPEARMPVITEYAELLMLDAIKCHDRLFGRYTPLMRCFYGHSPSRTRASWTHFLISARSCAKSSTNRSRHTAPINSREWSIFR